MQDKKILEVAKSVLKLEAQNILTLMDEMPNDFVPLIKKVMGLKGKVVISGMGKSGIIGRKISATLSSTGTASYFIHPSEASHGDLGIIDKLDLCILISNSGETHELNDLIEYTRRFSIPLVGISSNSISYLIKNSDYKIILPSVEEACGMGLVPTSSTTLVLALGDALAVSLLKVKNFMKDDFGIFHPGGKLGARLLSVRKIMRGADELTIVKKDSTLKDVVLNMSGKGYGVSIVVNKYNKILGIITDGDLRRNFDYLNIKNSGDIMNTNPITISEDSLAKQAIQLMQKHKVYSIVVEKNSEPIGLLRMHDLMRNGIV
jgi:arabinose-5-phosphate isomerase